MIGTAEQPSGPVAAEPTWEAVAAKLSLVNKSYGESDEGDYDYYSIFQLEYDGATIWTGRESRSSNVSGAWGSQINANLSGDKKTLLVRVTNVNERLGGGGVQTENTKSQEQLLSVFDLLKENGALTDAELSNLKALEVNKDEAYAPATAGEQGSTWQLHSGPFA